MPEDLEYQRGWLLDLNSVGVGLLLPRPVPANTPIGLVVKKARKTYDLAGLVVHSTFRAQGEWTIGVKFIVPLDNEDMEDLLS